MIKIIAKVIKDSIIAPVAHVMLSAVKPQIRRMLREESLKIAKDIDYQRRLRGCQSTAEYVSMHMPLIPRFFSRGELYEYVCDHVETPGLALEFGVATGKTINLLSSLLPDLRFIGFDSFKGLPEDWRANHRKSAFEMKGIPDVNSNVELRVGLIKDTLPVFVSEIEQRIVLLHIDCDLYSSTREVFDYLGPMLKPGCVIIFDEYFNYPEWQEHEYKAFKEFIGGSELQFEFLAFTCTDAKVAVILR